MRSKMSETICKSEVEFVCQEIAPVEKCCKIHFEIQSIQVSNAFKDCNQILLR